MGIAVIWIVIENLADECIGIGDQAHVAGSAGVQELDLGHGQLDARIVEGRVGLEHVLEVVDRGAQGSETHYPQRLQAQQVFIQHVGRRDGRRLAAALSGRRGERHLQRLGDLSTDLVLYVKDAGQRVLEAFRPQLEPAGRIDQLHRDTHALALLANAAFEQICDAECTRDFDNAELTVLERER